MPQVVEAVLLLLLGSKLTRAYNFVVFDDGALELIIPMFTTFSSKMLGNFIGQNICHSLTDEVPTGSKIVKILISAQRTEVDSACTPGSFLGSVDVGTVKVRS